VYEHAHHPIVMPSKAGDPTPTALSRAVRARRAELGLTQTELADLAGASRRFVHALEAGKPTLQLDKVLAVLKVVGLDLVLEPGGGEIR
jgi:y4mF family transcriptional regulator